MPFIAYETKKFSAGSLAVIAQARAICSEYADAGYGLTLRQLYYQFVARGLIPNKVTEYKRLGSIVNDARMAGMLDWDWISDRTRNMQQRSNWAHPRSIIQASAEQFHLNYWADQPYYVEVWVEKEALAGVIEQTCWPLDVPTLACRGYMSQSEQWSAGRRFRAAIKRGQAVRVIHLGDHDPSGIDMTRDNHERLCKFILMDLLTDLGIEQGSFRSIAERLHDKFGLPAGRVPFDVNRIALTMDQIVQYDPPPNPAKATDARFAGYEATYGDESWELDALPPDVLDALVSDAIEEYVDRDKMDAMQRREQAYRANVQRLLDEHGDVLDAEVA